ncbi:hypothetical protein ROI_30350 [Roseburia intestinalis M50/1]|nr:hypothetical protein ROI_30350 [Roseburia intestinalis M50/1]
MTIINIKNKLFMRKDNDFPEKNNVFPGNMMIFRCFI